MRWAVSVKSAVGAAVVGIWVSAIGPQGCSCAGPQTKPANAEKKPVTREAITREQAIEKASEAVRAQGKKLQEYDVTVEERGSEWRVRFTGKPPTPPGKEVAVDVSKVDGSAQVFLGE